MFGAKIITLTFTDTAIKAVLARPTSKGFKISFLGKKGLPASTVFNGRIINESIFQEALKTFYLENYAKLSLLLPFDLNAAKIVYNKVSEKNYQITTAKTANLSQLSRIVRDAGLSLVAIAPLPIIFPRLIGSQKTPYLFISSEEDLVFSLVVDNIVVFSSTYTLKNQLAESEKEVLLAVSEIIELEYKKYVQEPLKNVFVYGKGAEFLKSFLNAKDRKSTRLNS